MKAKFTVSSTLKARGERSGVEDITTPMLMVGKFSGMSLSADLEGLNADSGGRITDELTKSSFRGESGEHVTIALDGECKQKNVLVVGLGRAVNFQCATVRDTITLAINRAIDTRSEKLSIPILPGRVTSASLGLQPFAYIVKCVAEGVLARTKKEGELLIELVTTPQGARHVKAGLAQERRTKKKRCEPCSEIEPAAKDTKTTSKSGRRSGGKPTAKKDCPRAK